MVRARAGGTGSQFNMGEMTVTRCAVQMDGSTDIGFGYVAGRSPRKSELVAALDALLQDSGRGEELMAKHVLPLEAAQAARRRSAAGKIAKTKVEFFTMARGG